MSEFSAFDGFPSDEGQDGPWSLWATSSTGQNQRLRLRPPLDDRQCALNPTTSDGYPNVCKVWARNVARGQIAEPGYLLLSPAGVRHSNTPEATIRFTAPAAAKYHVSAQVKSAELGYGSTYVRLFKTAGPANTDIARVDIPKSYGHIRTLDHDVTLDRGESVSLSLGPSPNGENSADGTLIKFEVSQVLERVGWTSLYTSLALGIGLSLVLFLVLRVNANRRHLQD